MDINWDEATVTLKVPVHFTATSDVAEIELSLESFARLLLTKVPSSWFVEPPVSDDLPMLNIKD